MWNEEAKMLTDSFGKFNGETFLSREILLIHQVSIMEIYPIGKFLRF